MKRIIPLIFILLSFIGNSIAQSACKEVIAYYASWKWYNRNKLVNPQTVQYEKYTLINYSFFRPLSDGHLQILDPWADKNQLLGPINWATAPAGYDTQYDFGNPIYHHPNKKMSDYAHQANCKLSISVGGGGTLSDYFSTIAADATKRANLASDCNTIVKLYNLDGIDIDWEYPGYAGSGGSPSDKQNFTLLLQQIRDSLNQIEPQMGRHLLLTAAVGVSPARFDDIEWNDITPLLDVVNAMTYDYYGTFNSVTNHNSPLFPPAVGISGFSCQESIDGLLSLGVPTHKLAMGIPFYARTHLTTSAPALHVQGTGIADTNYFESSAGTPVYYQVLPLLDSFNYHWDAQAKAPYLTGKTKNIFLSYDNEASVEQKGFFVNARNLKGVVIWEMSGDYFETSIGSGTIGATPLIDKLNQTLCSGTVEISPSSQIEFVLYPNPAKEHIGIFLNESLPKWAYRLQDLQGRILQEQTLIGQDFARISLENYPEGLYFLQIQSSNQQITKKILKE